MRAKTLILAVAFFCMAFGGAANATELAWQTAPVLGTAYSYTGDVVITTTTGAITIPHYSLPGDPLNGVGGPSMTLFGGGQSVVTGSGVWVVPGVTYDITGVFQQISGGSRTVTYGETYTGNAEFIMEAFFNSDYLTAGSPMSNLLTSADIGKWTYTETWTAGSNSITATNAFTVIPEPGTMLLLGAALLGLGAARRYSRKL